MSLLRGRYLASGLCQSQDLGSRIPYLTTTRPRVGSGEWRERRNRQRSCRYGVRKAGALQMYVGHSRVSKYVRPRGQCSNGVCAQKVRSDPCRNVVSHQPQPLEVWPIRADLARAGCLPPSLSAATACVVSRRGLLVVDSEISVDPDLSPRCGLRSVVVVAYLHDGECDGKYRQCTSKGRDHHFTPPEGHVVCSLSCSGGVTDQRGGPTALTRLPGTTRGGQSAGRQRDGDATG